MHCNKFWSFKHAFNIVPSQNLDIFLQDSFYSLTLEHETSILREFYAMPPDTFPTELHDSLTAFYKKILKKAGVGGRPVAKPEALDPQVRHQDCTRA